MPEIVTDPIERRQPTPPATPATAFLWLGLLCLLAAAGTGIATAVTAGGASVRTAWVVALIVLAAGCILLLAQTRYLLWRQAAGILEAHPLTPAALKKPDAAARLARRRELVLCLMIAVVAALPRFMPLLHSLWYDELWTVAFMRSGPLYAITHQAGYNNHLLNSLLGSLCLQAYTLLTGQRADGATLALLVRLPAFAFGVGAVVMLYIAARDHLETPAALAAAALLAFSPTAIDLSAQTRGYSALIFFAIAQTYFLSAALRDTAAYAWVGWLLCAVLGTFAHLYFVLIVATDALFLLCLIIWEAVGRENRLRARTLFEQSVMMALAWAALASASYAGVWHTFLEVSRRTAELTPMARAHDVVLPTLQLWGGVPQGDRLSVFLVVTALFVILGLWYLAQRTPGAAVYLPLLLLVPFAIIEAAQTHFVYPRFFAFALPALLTLIAAGLWHATRLLLGPRPEQAVWNAPTLSALCLGFIALTLPGLRQVEQLPKQDYRHAAEALAAEASMGHTLAAVGTGNEYFRTYALPIALPRSEPELRALWQEKGTLVVADTGLVVNPTLHMPRETALVHASGQPFLVFPGRYADWPARWLDGDADITLYRLPAYPTDSPAYPTDSPAFPTDAPNMTIRRR